MRQWRRAGCVLLPVARLWKGGGGPLPLDSARNQILSELCDGDRPYPRATFRRSKYAKVQEHTGGRGCSPAVLNPHPGRPEQAGLNARPNRRRAPRRGVCVRNGVSLSIVGGKQRTHVRNRRAREHTSSRHAEGRSISDKSPAIRHTVRGSPTGPGGLCQREVGPKAGEYIRRVDD